MLHPKNYVVNALQPQKKKKINKKMSEIVGDVLTDVTLPEPFPSALQNEEATIENNGKSSETNPHNANANLNSNNAIQPINNVSNNEKTKPKIPSSKPPPPRPRIPGSKPPPIPKKLPPKPTNIIETHNDINDSEPIESMTANPQTKSLKHKKILKLNNDTKIENPVTDGIFQITKNEECKIFEFQSNISNDKTNNPEITIPNDIMATRFHFYFFFIFVFLLFFCFCVWYHFLDSVQTGSTTCCDKKKVTKSWLFVE